MLPDKGEIAFLKEMYEKYGIEDIKVDISPQIGGCAATCVNSIIIGPEGEFYKCWVDVGKKERIISNLFDGNIQNLLLPSYIVGSDMLSDSQYHHCTFLPLCDGGCTVRRYNKLHQNTQYDPCPIDRVDFDSLLDFHALKYKKK